MKRVVGICLMIWMCGVVKKNHAQDLHFSQFDVFQASLSPALAGFMESAYRFSLINRNQWRSVSVPYRTFGLHAEAASPLSINGLGVGLVFLTDRAGDSRFTTNKLGLSSNYRIDFKAQKIAFAFGAQIKFVQYKIDYSQLAYDAQYNGFFYDPSLPSGEQAGIDNVRVGEFALGTVFRKSFSKTDYFSLFGGFFNLSNPGVSWLGDASVTQDTRVNLGGQGYVTINKKYAALPALVYAVQGPLQELVLGGRVKRIIKERRRDSQAVYGGMYWRNRDALYLSVGMDYNDWYGGLSYDVNLSSLKEASNARGGFELVLVYKISKFNAYLKSHKTCPTFF